MVDLVTLPVAAAYFCPHMAGASIAAYDLDCPNRKPKPGFILKALERFGARASECLFVGDASTDREAAQESYARAMDTVRYRKLNGLSGYERELLGAPTWQFREIEEALR